jgi:WD40 repeat protein
MKENNTKPQLIIPSGHLASKDVNYVVISPNNQWLLTYSADQSMILWDVSGKYLRRFKLKDSPSQIIFLNDLDFIIGYHNGKAEQWNIAEGKTRDIFKDLERRVRAISADGKKFALAAGKQWGSSLELDPSFSVWDDIKKVHYPCPKKHDLGITHMVLNKDGSLAVTGSYDHLVKLWNLGTNKINSASTGEVIRTLEKHREHKEGVSRVAISPDDKYIVSGSEHGKIYVYETNTGAFIKSLDGHSTKIRKFQFSADGKTFISVTETEMIKWNTDNWSMIGESIPLHYPTFTNFCTFSDDLSLCLYSKSLELYNVNTGDFVADFRGKTCEIDNAIISANDKMLAFRSKDGLIRTWKFNTNQPTLNFEYTPYLKKDKDAYSYLSGFDVLPVSGNLLLRNSEDDIYLLDKHSFVPYQELTIPKKYDFIRASCLSPDGNYMALACYENKESPDEKTFILDLATGQDESFSVTEDEGDVIETMAYAHSGDKLLIGVSRTNDHNSYVKVVDLRTREMLAKFKCGEHKWNGPKSVDWSSDDSKIVVSLENGWIYTWDLADGQKRKGFIPTQNRGGKEYDRAHLVKFSPDDSKLVAAYYDSRTFIIWDYDSGEEEKVIDDHLSGSEGFNALISFSADGDILFTSATGNAIFLWELHTGARLASLYFLGENDWGITTPSGLFDASEGAMQMMYYLQGFETIELEQLKNRYYEPDLLNKLMTNGVAGLRNVSELDEVDLYPEVKATIKTDQLHIELTERSGGLGRVVFYYNGKAVWEDKNEQGKKHFTIDLKHFNKYKSTVQDNILSVRAYNKAGWLVSPEVIAKFESGAQAKAGRENNSGPKLRRRKKNITHNLYAIFVGTGKYRGKQMNLKYPEKDAGAMAKAIEALGANLFGTGNQEVKLLTTAKKGAEFPTKANIKKVFDGIAAKAKADDVCFMYFSGHGDNWGKGDDKQFYYLTTELLNNDISDKKIRDSQTISSSEITEWTNKIPCRLQVMVLDACHSGKALESFMGGKKAVDSARIRALDRMKDRTGMFVLAGSPGDQVSWETSHFGQGLLTYSLLFGMTGASHVIEGNNRFVDVMKLLQYSRDRVPQLAKEIGQEQQPVLATPKGGDSFDIGIYTDKVKIDIASRRPILVKSVLLDKNSYYDDLSLTDLLDQRLLKENSFGNTARLTFVNIAKFNNAYTIRGVYEQKGNEVEVDIRIYRNGQLKGKLKLKKTKKDLGVLIEDIVDKMAKLPT